MPAVDATLTADFAEAAEPNDSPESPAGTVAVPALDASVVLRGCITPQPLVVAPTDGGVDAGSAADAGFVNDVDVWALTTTGPVALEVTVDGVGGLVGGFAVQHDGSDPALANFQRLGLNFAGDTAQRQLYLPRAGTWLFAVLDGRTMLNSGPVGGSPSSCYFATVRQVPLPAASPLTLPSTGGTYGGALQVFTHTAASEGEVFELASVANPELQPSFVLSRASSLQVSRDVGGTERAQAGALSAMEQLTVVFDPQVHLGVLPAPYSLDALAVAGQPLPTGGSTVMVTRPGGGPGLGGVNLLYFDVPQDGALLRFDVTASVPVDMRIVRAGVLTGAGAWDDVAVIDPFGGSGRAAFQNEHVRFLRAGRYYFVLADPAPGAMPGTVYTVTSTVTAVTPVALVDGSPQTGVALPASGAQFFTVDFTNPVWKQFRVTGTNFPAGPATARLDAFDLAGEGWVGSSGFPAVFGGAQNANGSTPLGRILFGDTRDFLLRVQPVGATTGPVTMDVLAGDHAFTNVGTVADNMPVMATPQVPPGGVARFFARASPGNTLRIQVGPDPMSDVSLQRRGADEAVLASANAAGLGGQESLFVSVPAAPANYVAWTITNLSMTTASTAQTSSARRPGRTPSPPAWCHSSTRARGGGRRWARASTTRSSTSRCR